MKLLSFNRPGLPKWFVILNYCGLSPILLYPFVLFGSLFVFAMSYSIFITIPLFLLINSYPLFVIVLIRTSLKMYPADEDPETQQTRDKKFVATLLPMIPLLAVCCLFLSI